MGGGRVTPWRVALFDPTTREQLTDWQNLPDGERISLVVPSGRIIVQAGIASPSDVITWGRVIDRRPGDLVFVEKPAAPAAPAWG